MSVLPQFGRTERQRVALQEWAQRTGTVALFILVTTAAIVTALIFGSAVWLVALCVVLMITLGRSLVAFFRDEP